MMIIGQQRIYNELSIISEQCKQGKNFNIGLFAPSGWGKTTLANNFIFQSITKGERYSSTVITDDYDYSDFYLKNDKIRYIFLDEAHLIPKPEWLYPLMNKERFTFIIATNESGLLKVPFLNRCLRYTFDPYSQTELRMMVHLYLGVYETSKSWNYLSNNICDKIIKAAKSNPRGITEVAERIKLYISPENLTDKNIIGIMTNLGYNANGLNSQELAYLVALKRNGSKASLTLLCNILGQTKETVVRDIEPGLVQSGYINIESKGRILIKEF